MIAASAPAPLDRPATAEEPERLRALRHLLDGLIDETAAPEERYFDAASQTVVDAVLAQDHAALSGIADYLRNFQSHWCDAGRENVGWAEALGRLRGLLAVAFLAAERIPPPQVVGRVAPRSRAHRLLNALADVTTLHTLELIAATGLDATAISHLSRQLEVGGLIVRKKVGKSRYYEITPLGREALRLADASHPPVRSAVTERGPSQPHALDSDLLVECTSWKPVAVEAQDLSRARQEAARGQERSRVLLFDFLVHNHSEMTRRLLSWDEIGRFAGDEHIRFAVPPLHASTAAWRRSTVDVIDRLHGPGLDLLAFWPVTMPAFDAFALVQGADGRPGVVLIEAKSEAREFKLGKVAARRAEQQRQLDRALKQTSTYVGARKGWKAWTTNFPDPASRLAMLYFLRENDVPAWLLNVYFVRPDLPSSGARPPSAIDWWAHIQEVRDDLAISGDHGLSSRIKNEFVELP